MSPESFSDYMFLYQNLTNFVELDNKVNQLWFSDLDEDPFSVPEKFTDWIYERSESFKTIFCCEWAVVSSEFESENWWHFKELFSADFFRKVAWCHEHLSSTLRNLIIIKHGNQGKNMSCGVSINSSTRQDFDYAFTFRCNYEHIFDISVYFLLKIA